MTFFRKRLRIFHPKILAERIVQGEKMNSEDSRMQKAVEQRKVNSNRLTAKQPLTSLKNQKQ